MNTNVIPFTGGRPPAVFAGRQSILNAAAKAGVQASFAVLGIRGKNWRIKHRGEEELVTQADGSPMQKLPVVIVGVSPNISKQWYDRKYVEGADDAPDCFSIDGISPDPQSPKKQAALCATCPKNVWGSRLTEEGKKAKACQDSRRLAVVPLHDIENESYGGPMMLRLPATSINNLATYAALLERKGAGLEFVATNLKFDYDAAFPRVEFEPIGWLSEEQAVQVVGPDGASGMCAHPSLESMLMEAVEHATAEPTANDADALAGPPPAAAQQRTMPAAAPTGFVQQPQPTAPVAAEAPQPEPAPAQPPKRQRASSGFQAAAQAPANGNGAAPAPTNGNGAAPAPVMSAPPVTVQAAPLDMQAAIDELLNAP